MPSGDGIRDASMRSGSATSRICLPVRGGVVGAEAAQVAPAEIIGIQDHDVRGPDSPHGRSFTAPGAARVLACAGPSPWEWGSGPALNGDVRQRVAFARGG